MSTSLATFLVLAGAGGLCWWGAQSAANFIERQAAGDVRLALRIANHEWVKVDTNGLQVRLTGTAPSEVQRFRATAQAATAVDASRIIDDMTVATTEALTPPQFKIELLRNEDGISLIGLVPASTDRDRLMRDLDAETAAPKVTDLLESAEYPAPDGWEAAVEFGLNAMQMVSRAKISIQPGAVGVDAVTDSRAEKGRLETELSRSRPKGVELTTSISSPRPVIAPFTLRFLIDENGPHFDACAADTEPGRDRILEAAIAAGVGGKPGCTLGLGSPTPDWADAAIAAIQSVATLGAGSVTISDADIALIAPPGVDRDQFDSVVGTLEGDLPPVFSLQAQLELPSEAGSGPIEFRATMARDRQLNLQGRITSLRMREAVDSFARARFAGVDSSLRSDDSVPAGWTVKVIAALEAMDALYSGTVEVTPELIRLTGTSGDPRAADLAAATLSHRLGAGAKYQLSIRYDRRLDPALGLPDGDECVDELNIIMSESEIGFEPSRSTVAGDPAPTLERLSKIMTLCAEFQVEAGGHTDSQGSEGFNADLSRARAQALVSLMGEAGIDTVNMTARGYGESQPVASNETEEGREANRRIEFRLLSTQPVRTEPLPEPQMVSGVTSEGAEAPQSPGAGSGEKDDLADLMQGPPMPVAETGSGMVARMFGVSEEFESLDAREERIRLPVLTPDEDTPRPSPRPESLEAAMVEDVGEAGQDTTGQGDATAQ